MKHALKHRVATEKIIALSFAEQVHSEQLIQRTALSWGMWEEELHSVLKTFSDADIL